MARAVPQLELDRLGSTRLLAIRKLLTEFRAHGWRDTEGAAISMIDHIVEAGGHASPRAVAAAVPTAFLAINGLSRSELVETLETLAERRR